MNADNTIVKGERIAKVIARAGLCSRRDAERWIADGRVQVNGNQLDTPAFLITPADIVIVDGTPLDAPEAPRLWRYHKPPGLVTTHKDPEGRATVFENLPSDHNLPRVISVGRLDLNTEGLLLLTNDGGLSRSLENPDRGWLRRYRVRAFGRADEKALGKLAKGIEIDGVQYGAIEATVDRVQGANTWLTMGLREGKNREIRKVMEHLGLTVNRLIRISYGPFQLGKLARGNISEVPAKVVKDQLGGATDNEATLKRGTARVKPKPSKRPRKTRGSKKHGAKP